MSGMIERIKGWRKPKDTIHEETTERQRQPEGFIPREESPMFVPDITIEQVIYNSRNEIQMNINTGVWDLERNWKHMVAFYSAAKHHTDLMENIIPDEMFKNEIIVAEREPDFVEQGRAMLRACDKLQLRREVGMKQKAQMGIFDEDLEELYSHLPEVDEPDLDHRQDDDMMDYEDLDDVEYEEGEYDESSDV
jgi:hypothetical protein